MTPERLTKQPRTTQLAATCGLMVGLMFAGWSGEAQAQLLAADNLEQHIGATPPPPVGHGDTMDGLGGGSGTPGWGANNWVVPTTTNAVLWHTTGVGIESPLEVTFTSGSISGGERAMRLPNAVDSTALVYRNFPASFTGTTSDPIRDIWVTLLVRVEQTPTAGETLMVEIIGQQNSELNSAPADVAGLGIRPTTVDGITAPRFVAQTQSATPAIFTDFLPVGGNDYYMIAWFRASGVSGGLRWDRPRLWVYQDNDPFTLVASAPMAEGSGSTRTYSNSAPTGASRIRVRTAGLGSGDIFALDGLAIARTISEVIDPGGPLRVDLMSFTASADGAGSPVTLNWETAAEFDNAGFNVYRGANGAPGQKLNAFPIAAQGSETEGAFYSFVDSTPLDRDEARSYYLEDVEFSGVKTLHGPVRVGPFSGARSSVDSWALYN